MNIWERFERLSFLEKIAVIRLLPGELKGQVVERLETVATNSGEKERKVVRAALALIL